MENQSNPLPVNNANLDALGQRNDLTVPTYDRGALRKSIVHLGVGGFHRAHLATYVDELCAAGNTDWSIVGSGVLPGDAKMAEVLGDQDGLYTLVTRGPDSTTMQVVGSITDYIHAAVDPDALAQRIADPDTQVVSLTVTEAGYPIDDKTGEFLPDSPNAGPTSAFGLIAAGLELRQANSGGALTVLSCDNILSNGQAAKTATLNEASRVSDDLRSWAEANVSFPNSMVDRITPATSDDDRAWLASSENIEDGWPVVTEPFRQWIIQDDFAGDRPPLEELDVIITDDVEPYEHMKLQLLNAGHSCLAYLAALEGIESVDQAMAHPDIRAYVRAFLEQEAKPVVPDVVGIDVDDYIDSLIERFSNPNIGDQISRLCMDGSAKLPKFLLPTIRAQLADGGPVALSALTLASWCAYLQGATSAGAPIDIAPDPALDAAKQHAAASADDPKAFLQFSEVFDADLAGNETLVNEFELALARLRSDGAPGAINALL